MPALRRDFSGGLWLRSALTLWGDATGFFRVHQPEFSGSHFALRQDSASAARSSRIFSAIQMPRKRRLGQGRENSSPSQFAREVGQRLKRVLELYPSRKNAAEIAGRSDDQLASYVAGESSPTFEAIARLMRAKGVSLDWLASGEGPFHTVQRLIQFEQQTGERPPGVPVLGLAECGLRGWYGRGPLSVSATRPGDFFDPDGFAVLAIGQSMVPAGISEGYLCFCSPRTPASPGDAVYIERTNNVATLKVFSSMIGEWLTVTGWLDPVDGKREPYTEQLLVSDIKRIAPVIYVKRKL